MIEALVEHGVTPSVIAARMTTMGAPESLQGAVAAGLLGLGNTFVGTIEGAARVCQTELPGAGRHDVPLHDRLGDDGITALAAKIFDEHKAALKTIAGIGHPVHKPVDPRAQRLFALAAELGYDDSAPRLMTAISAVASERSGKVLPVNVTGAIGALSATVGIPWKVERGLGVMARCWLGGPSPGGFGESDRWHHLE